MTNPSPLLGPAAAREQFTRLAAWRDKEQRDLDAANSQLDGISHYLCLADKVTDALEQLSQRLFRELLDVIEREMTKALQEVLDQPLRLKTEIEWKRNAASIDFWIDNDGNREDILKGQGGSVANILSVGLRMFALMTLEEKDHRPFLVLDEQDCWLRPDLVSRMVKIVHDAGTTLGFQVLMISHHDTASFQQFADRIYHLEATGKKGIKATLIQSQPSVTDTGVE